MTYSHWAVGSNGLLQLEATDRTPDDDVNPECINPRTEFLLHFLGHGRVLIQPCSFSSSSLTLVKAQMKGEVKLETVSEITVNHVWEI